MEAKWEKGCLRSDYGKCSYVIAVQRSFKRENKKELPCIILQNVWIRLNYRLDMCRVTKKVRVEHLQNKYKTWIFCGHFHISIMYVSIINLKKSCFESVQFFFSSPVFTHTCTRNTYSWLRL